MEGMTSAAMQAEARTLAQAEPYPLDAVIDAILEDLRTGNPPLSSMFAIARAQAAETADFCLRRLSDPALSPVEVEGLLRFVEQTGVAGALVARLLTIDGSGARVAARRLRHSTLRINRIIACHLEAEQVDIVVRALDLLEVVGPCEEILPELLALVDRNLPRTHPRIFRLIRILDPKHETIRPLLTHPNAKVRSAALESVLDSAGNGILDAIGARTTDSDVRVRSLAAVALHRSGDPRGIALLRAMIADPDPQTRSMGAATIGMLGYAEHKRDLIALASSDPDERVRFTAVAAVSKSVR